MQHIHSYNWTINSLRTFFYQKEFIEINCQSDYSLLKNILNNHSYIATFNLNGSVHMLPQTYQHILQSKFADSPYVKGMYVIYNKHINTGIVPSVDIIARDIDKYVLLNELLDHFQYNIDIDDIKTNYMVDEEQSIDNKLILSTPDANSSLWSNKYIEKGMVDEDTLILNNFNILSLYKNEDNRKKIKKQFEKHNNFMQFDKQQVQYEITQYLQKDIEPYVGVSININHLIKSLDDSLLLFKEKTTTTDGCTQTVKKQRIRCWTLPGDDLTNKAVRGVSSGLSMAMEKGLDAIL